jgi:hypothetical protein
MNVNFINQMMIYHVNMLMILMQLLTLDLIVYDSLKSLLIIYLTLILGLSYLLDNYACFFKYFNNLEINIYKPSLLLLFFILIRFY